MELFSDERNALRIVFAQRGKSLAGILENGVPVFSRADRKALVALVIVLDVYIPPDVPLTAARTMTERIAISDFFINAASCSVIILRRKKSFSIASYHRSGGIARRNGCRSFLFTKFRLYGAAKRGTLRTMSGGAAAEATERKGRIKR